MSRLNIIRAWKDEAYRMSLSAAERALLPDNPAGAIELADPELGQAAGGAVRNARPKYTDFCSKVATCQPGYCSLVCLSKLCTIK
jgi:mersacidin/lichenicidin family type 2 lantibiotic